MTAQTLYEKLWDAHVIERLDDGTCLLWVDRQLIYELTSRAAFQSLRAAGRPVHRPRASLAMPDHAVPTKERDRLGRRTLALLDDFRSDCASAGIELFDLGDDRHGIVHVVGPELGYVLPGMLVVCADSHTSTHGALGALSFGVGTSELEHVLATQTILKAPSAPMRITVEGRLSSGVVAKDLALAIIGKVGAAGAVGHAVEFAGEGIDALSVEGRLTLCNMAVEAGARSALVAPDQVTFDWLHERPMTPRGDLWHRAREHWGTLRTDPGAVFVRETSIDAGSLAPQVTWGTSPDHVVGVTDSTPDPRRASSAGEADSWRRALEYMGLEPGRDITSISIDRVFIGSCTNSRIEDLRSAAAVVRGRRLARDVRGMVVPGSATVRAAAEREGLDRAFLDAGFEWREAGCSMCFGTKHDSVGPFERCASTSNRNFEHRQGRHARTHLMSPAMAAAAGIAGHVVDVRDVLSQQVFEVDAR